MKIRTNKAILYFYDIEQKQLRRVIFGNPEGLYDFFVEQSAILNSRLVKVSGKYKNKKDLRRAIKNSQEEWVTDNGYGAFDESQVLEFSYEIVKK